jgi:hypothetical protein
LFLRRYIIEIGATILRDLVPQSLYVTRFGIKKNCKYNMKLMFNFVHGCVL